MGGSTEIGRWSKRLYKMRCVLGGGVALDEEHIIMKDADDSKLVLVIYHIWQQAKSSRHGSKIRAPHCPSPPLPLILCPTLTHPPTLVTCRAEANTGSAASWMALRARASGCRSRSRITERSRSDDGRRIGLPFAPPLADLDGGRCLRLPDRTAGSGVWADPEGPAGEGHRADWLPKPKAAGGSENDLLRPPASPPPPASMSLPLLDPASLS